GAAEETSPETLAQLRAALEAQGIAPEQMHLRLAPRRATAQEVADGLEACAQSDTELVLDIGPLGKRQHDSNSFLAMLQKAGAIDAPLAQQVQANVAEATLPLMTRMRRDGVLNALKHEYKQSPI